MTRLASLGEAPSHVVWVLGVVEVLNMTSDAGRGPKIVVIVDVAAFTCRRRHGMSARQKEARSRVVKFRVEPAIRGVAAFAGRLERHAPSHVIRIRRALELLHVARQTIRGHRLELAVARILVAGIAIHRGMRASQRKAIVVGRNILDRHTPAADGVTLLAVRAQRALVNVSVAVLAFRSYIGKYRLDVAGGAGHRNVHATQRILCCVVVKFRNCPDRLPALRRVAVLTRKIEIAVRTLRRGNSLRLTARHQRGQGHQHCC